MRLDRSVAARQLVLVGLAVMAISLVVWVVRRRGGGLVPGVPWVTILLLVVLAALVVSAAWPVRAYLRGRRREVDMLRAARALTLAQAGALTGSAALGWYLGQLLVALPDVDLTVVRNAAERLALAVVASAVLVAAGLWAQRMCRIPPDDKGPGSGASNGSGRGGPGSAA
ncbi:conserved membrane hypothetical protein [Nostocoides japonicum T1-X7]|uniref:Integral membrane protein n=1 Tax=Nostocoides japonicum T1-X7 TaxID=1194083 RepID=A0A077M3K7_9MICO|nr:DUF3180 domain-containing protein [Tetrasphaera japonica]CCH80401.1 conserved membrane hypothetical protein [Tetrasphaera japonica T1-X7]